MPRPRPLRPHEVEQYLEENDLLIQAIKQNQNLGRLHECVQYQLQLQQNLVHLVIHADEQPGILPLRLRPQFVSQADSVTSSPLTDNAVSGGETAQNQTNAAMSDCE